MTRPSHSNRCRLGEQFACENCYELLYSPPRPSSNGKPKGPDKPHADKAPVEPVLVRLSDVQSQPVEWLWPGRIALGKLSLIAGDPGLGKSFVTLFMAARVSSGGFWPDVPMGKISPGGVVLLSAEDDIADTIRPRLDAAGADVSRIVAIPAVRRNYNDNPAKEFTFSLETDLPALEKAIQSVPGCLLVIIDPITAYLGETDSHKNAEIRGLLTALAALAAKYGVAVVCVTHLNKSANGPAIYRAIGSIAFAAAARSVLAVIKDKENPRRRLMLPTKNNLALDVHGLAYTIEPSGPGGAPVVVWEPDPVDISADDAMTDTDSANATRDDDDQTQAWLREALKDGPMPAQSVLDQGKANGFTHKAIRRAFHALDGQRKKADFKGGWIWWLPDAEHVHPTDEESSASSQKHEESSANPSPSNHEDAQDSRPSEDGEWGVVS